MRFECLENSLINQKYTKDQMKRQRRKLHQISNRKPVFAPVYNKLILPIIKSKKVQHLNENKRIMKENQAFTQRIDIIKNARSQYAYTMDRARSLSPTSRIYQKKIQKWESSTQQNHSQNMQQNRQ